MFQVEDGGQENIQSIDFLEENRPVSPPLHLATGLGIVDTGGFGDSIETLKYMTADSDNAAKTEEFYRIMVQEHPLDPLSLRNLARFLSEVNFKIPFPPTLLNSQTMNFFHILDMTDQGRSSSS